MYSNTTARIMFNYSKSGYFEILRKLDFNFAHKTLL